MLKEYIHSFVKDERGVETIEFLGMVIVGVALVYVATNIAAKVSKKGSSSTNRAMNEMDYNDIKSIVDNG